MRTIIYTIGPNTQIKTIDEMLLRIKRLGYEAGTVNKTLTFTIPDNVSDNVLVKVGAMLGAIEAMG